jgi:hypothetical protein
VEDGLAGLVVLRVFVLGTCCCSVSGATFLEQRVHIQGLGIFLAYRQLLTNLHLSILWGLQWICGQQSEQLSSKPIQ